MKRREGNSLLEDAGSILRILAYVEASLWKANLFNSDNDDEAQTNSAVINNKEENLSDKQSTSSVDAGNIDAGEAKTLPISTKRNPETQLSAAASSRSVPTSDKRVTQRAERLPKKLWLPVTRKSDTELSPVAKDIVSLVRSANDDFLSDNVTKKSEVFVVRSVHPRVVACVSRGPLSSEAVQAVKNQVPDATCVVEWQAGNFKGDCVMLRVSAWFTESQRKVAEIEDSPLWTAEVANIKKISDYLVEKASE